MSYPEESLYWKGRGMDSSQSEPVVSSNGQGEAAANGWQPIETAPRDGTRVLVCEADEPTEVAVGWWIEGAWRDFGDIGCNGYEDYEPTHWMPLPVKPGAVEAKP